jgi:hypothetical protein
MSKCQMTRNLVTYIILFIFFKRYNGCITIRRNKQSMSTVEGSSSHLNRTESFHSSNVRSASIMIPCFPANNSTDAHHCDIVSNRSSPSHFTKGYYSF